MCEWGEFSYSEPPACQKPSEYMIWKKLVEQFEDGCLVHFWYVYGMILAISELPCWQKPSIYFLLKSMYGLKKMVVENF